jgi:hypothetical protein
VLDIICDARVLYYEKQELLHNGAVVASCDCGRLCRLSWSVKMHATVVSAILVVCLDVWLGEAMDSSACESQTLEVVRKRFLDDLQDELDG